MRPSKVVVTKRHTGSFTDRTTGDIYLCTREKDTLILMYFICVQTGDCYIEMVEDKKSFILKIFYSNKKLNRNKN